MRAINRVEVVEFKLDDIEKILYKHNPESRVESVRDVERGMIEYGRGKPAWDPNRHGVIGKDGYLGDGHRRYRAARNLGLKTGWFSQNLELTAEQIYLTNRPPKRISSCQKLEWALSRYNDLRSIEIGEVPNLSSAERKGWEVAQKYGGPGLLHAMVASRLGTTYPGELIHIYEKFSSASPGSKEFITKFRSLLKALYGKKVRMSQISAYYTSMNDGDASARVALRKLLNESIALAEEEFGT